MIEALLEEFITTLEDALQVAKTNSIRAATLYARARERFYGFFDFDKGVRKVATASSEQLERLLNHLPRLVEYLFTLPSGFNAVEGVYKGYIDNHFPLSKVSPPGQANYYLDRGHALLRCQHYVPAQKAYCDGLQITVYSGESWAQEKTQTFLHCLRSIEAVLISIELIELEVRTPLRAYNESVDLLKRLYPMLSYLHSEGQWEILYQLYAKLKPWVIAYYEQYIAISPFTKKESDLDTLMIGFSLACNWLKHGYYNAALVIFDALKSKSDFPKAVETRHLSIWIKEKLESVFESCREIKPESKSLDSREMLFLLPPAGILAKASQEVAVLTAITELVWPETVALSDYYQRLKTAQTALFSARALNGDILDAQKTFSTEITTLLQDLWRESEALLYLPPCGFEIIALGSLARGEFAPASDVDIAIMITDKQYRESKYFRTLINIFNTKLKTLGIAQPIDSNDDAHLGADEKRPDFDFIDTPEGFARRYAPALIRKGETAPAENYAIYHASSLYRTEKGQNFLIKYQEETGCSLLGYYQQQLLDHLEIKPKSAALSSATSEGKLAIPLSQNHRDVARRYFERHQEDLANAAKWQNLNIKERYLAPLTYACFNLMLYAGLHEESLAATVFAAIEKLKDRVLTQEFAEDILKAWQDLQKIRIQLHEAWLKHRWKIPGLKDNTYLNHSEATGTELCLTEIQLSRLSQINRLILQPLYTAVLGPKKESKEAISPTSPFIAWLDSPNQPLLDPVRYELEQGLLTLSKDALVPKIENWVELLCERQVNIVVHREQYQRLPDEYKEIYYKALKRFTPLPNLLNAIAAVPFKDGTSIAYTEAQTQWQTFLTEQFTTVLPVEEKTAAKELAKQFPKECLVQWLNVEGKLCNGFLHADFQTAWERAGYLSRHGFGLKQIKAAPDSKAETRGAKIDGRGYVFPIMDKRGQVLAYAKLYPEMPGRQALAESLAWHLSGYGAMSTLCKVTHLATGQVYPLLISQFRGETLQNHLRDGTLTTLESALDKESFTLKFLETLLLSYEDDKFDNIALEPFVNADGKISYRLISFDADRAFAEPFIKEELTEKNILRKQLKINAKSAVYCLEAMKQNLHPQIVIRFKEMQPLTLFTHWLQEPIVTHLMGRLFSQTEAIQFSQNKVHECFIPAAFELGTVSRLYQRFLRIQAALNDAELPQTHLELLSRIEPHLASFYEVVLQQPISAKARFDQLPTHYTFSEEKFEPKAPNDIPTASTAHLPTAISSPGPLRVQQTTGSTRTRMLNSITIQAAKGDFKRAIAEGTIANPAYVLKTELKPTHNHYRAIQEIRQALINGNSQPFLALSQANYNTDDLKAQVLKTLDWSTLKPKPPQTLEQLQAEILNALIGGKYYQLYFTNCIALTNDKLTAIIKGSLELQTLDVSGCIQLSEAPIRALATPHSLLHTLNLSRLPQLKCLSHVSFFRGAPTEPLIFSQLRRLNVSDCENLSVLQVKMPSGKQLSLEGCIALGEFEKAIALLLANEPTLTALDFRSTGELFGIYGSTFFKILAATLKHNHTLTELNLAWNKLDIEAGQALAELLKHNRILAVLHLSGNNGATKSAQVVMEALKHNHTLTSLHLARNYLGPEGGQMLATVFKHNTTLTALNLESNRLGTKGAQELADMLKYNHTLKWLNLGDNNLRFGDIELLVEAFEHNRTLSSLQLSHNDLSFYDIKVLAEMLKDNHTLTELKLRNTELGSVGVEALAEALEHNRTLVKLDLGFNYLDSEGAKALAEVLIHNHTLTELDLWGSTIDPEVLKALDAALERNKFLAACKVSVEIKSTITSTNTMITSSEIKSEKRRISSSAFFEPVATESKAILVENTPPITTQPASPSSTTPLPHP